MCRDRLTNAPCEIAARGIECGRTAADENLDPPQPAAPVRRRSVREILDAYDERLYKKYKEKYENGIPTR